MDLKNMCAFFDEDDEDDNDDAMKTLLAELILATKEQNAKTRLLAYQLLVDIPRRMEKEASERQGAIADGQVGNRAGVAEASASRARRGLGGATFELNALVSYTAS